MTIKSGDKKIIQKTGSILKIHKSKNKSLNQNKMKNLLVYLVFIFAVVKVKAQCNIESVKTDSYGIRVYTSGGSSQSYQYDGKSLYDYSSCWLVVARTGGNITIYDGKSVNSYKSITTSTSAAVKSVKVLGDKIKIEFEGGDNREYNIR